MSTSQIVFSCIMMAFLAGALAPVLLDIVLDGKISRRYSFEVCIFLMVLAAIVFPLSAVFDVGAISYLIGRTVYRGAKELLQ